jgi:hypothetical protein
MMRRHALARGWHALLVTAALVALGAAALTGMACTGTDAGPTPGVTIEPLPSRTPRSETPRAVATGGKRAAPTSTATAEPASTRQPAEEPSPAPATPTPAPSATPQPPAAPPATGAWIEVDVTNFVVRLMDGEQVIKEIAPVGVGAAIDTGAYISTQTGLFYVHNKAEPLVYDAPFDTYISHWVGFDAEKDNGFHSFLKDANGTVVDASTGRVSNGCIRTGEAEAVFAYAEIGMPVWVHW